MADPTQQVPQVPKPDSAGKVSAQYWFQANGIDHATANAVRVKMGIRRLSEERSHADFQKNLDEFNAPAPSAGKGS